MSWLQGQTHAQFFREGNQRFNRLLDEPAGMSQRVSCSAARVDQKHAGAKFGCLMDRQAGIVDALSKRLSFASSESSRPLQTGDADPRGIQQPAGFTLFEVGELWPPDRHRVEAVMLEGFKLFGEIPAKGCPFTD